MPKPLKPPKPTTPKDAAGWTCAICGLQGIAADTCPIDGKEKPIA